MPPRAWNICGPGIFIDSPEDDISFFHNASRCLNALRATDPGHILLSNICWTYGQRKHAVVIQPAKPPHFSNEAIPVTDISENFRSRVTMTAMEAFNYKKDEYGDGLVENCWPLTVLGKKGCSAIAVWNDDPENKRPKSLPPSKSDAAIGLAHELIHCLHYSRAECRRLITAGQSLTDDSALAEEEARTVGIGPYLVEPAEPLTENGVRTALGYGLREEYSPGNNLAHVTRTA